MHTCDSAIVRATLRQFWTTWIAVASDQTNGFEGRHESGVRTVTRFRVIRRQTIFYTLKQRRNNFFPPITMLWDFLFPLLSIDPSHTFTLLLPRRYNAWKLNNVFSVKRKRNKKEKEKFTVNVYRKDPSYVFDLPTVFLSFPRWSLLVPAWNRFRSTKWSYQTRTHRSFKRIWLS